MNVEKGLGRIAKAFGWLGTAVAGISLLISVAALFGDGSDKEVILMVGVATACVAYGVGRLLRWLIEGFTDEGGQGDGPSLASKVIGRCRDSLATKNGKKRMVAYGGFLLALIVPIVYEANFPKGGIDAPRSIGYMLGIGAFILPLGLLLLKKSKEWQGNFMVATSLISVIWVSAACYKEWEEHNQLKDSLRNVANALTTSNPSSGTPPLPSAVSLREVQEEIPALIVPGHHDSGAAAVAVLLNNLAKHIAVESEKMAALNVRFEAPDASLDKVLDPENFINPELLVDSRRKLQIFQSLIAERQTLIANHIKRSEEILRTAKLPAHQREEALKGFNESLPLAKVNYKKLDDSQLGMAKSAHRILDIAQRGMGVIRVQDGNVLFETQADVDAYNQGMEQIRQFAQKEQEAAQAIQQTAQKTQDGIAQLTKGN